MEKVQGIELEQVWPSMKVKDRFTVVKSIAAFQKAWTTISFKKFGSLYCSKDLEGQRHGMPLCNGTQGFDILDDEFAIGPTAAREWIDDGRATVSLNRGPCKLPAFNCMAID